MLGDIIVRLKADIGDYQKGLDSASKKTENFSKGVSSAAFGIAGAFTGMAVAATAGIGIAVKVASDYESAFTGVRKTTDATEKQFSELSDGIIKMTRKVPASATEIANVAAKAGQLGIKTKDMLKFTETMVNMGEAAESLTAEEAASSLARFGNIMDMPMDKIDKLASTVVHLGNNFATSEKEIIDMGQRIAGAGQAVGFTESEVMSLSAAMSSLGIRTEAGGTAASRVLLSINDAVSAGGDEMSKYAKVAGVTNKEFANMWKENPAGALDEVIHGLGKMGEEGKDVNGVIEDLGYTNVRTKDMLLRMSGAQDTFTDALGKGSKAWDENRALQDEVKERYSDLAQKLKILRNAVMEVVLAIGTPLLEVLSGMIDAMQPAVKWILDLVDKFNGLSDKTKRVVAIVTLLIPAFLLIVAAIAAAVGVFVLLAPIIGTVIVVGLKFIAIIGLVVGVIGLLVYAIKKIDWGALKDKAISAWDAIKNALSSAWESIKTVWGKVVDWFSDLWTSIKDSAVSVWDSIVDSINGVIESIKSVWNGIVEYFVGIWNNVMETTSLIWETITEVFMEVVTKIKTIFQPLLEFFPVLWENVKNIAVQAWEVIKQVVVGAVLLFILAITGQFEDFKNSLAQIWTNIKNALISLWTSVKDLVVGIVTALKQTTINLWKAIFDGIKNILTGIKDAAVASWNFIKNAVINAAKSLKTGAINAWNTLKSSVINAANALKQGAINAWNTLKSSVINAVNTVKSTAVSVWNAMKSAVIGTANALKDGIIGAWDTIKSKTKAAFDAVVDFIKNPLESLDLAGIGKDIIQGLINGIKDKVAAVGRAVKDVTDKITGKLKGILGIKSPSRVMKKEVGMQIMAGLIIGMEGEINPLQRMAEKVSEAAKPKIPKLDDFNVGDIRGHVKDLSGHLSVRDERDRQKQREYNEGNNQRDIIITMDGEVVARKTVGDINEINAIDEEIRRW